MLNNLNPTDAEMGRKSNNPATAPCQALTALAKECDWVLFEAQELSEMIRVSVDALTVCRSLKCPFPFGKSRPEWVLQFLKDHPDIACKDKIKRDVPASKIVSIKTAASKASGKLA